MRFTSAGLQRPNCAAAEITTARHGDGPFRRVLLPCLSCSCSSQHGLEQRSDDRITLGFSVWTNAGASSGGQEANKQQRVHGRAEYFTHMHGIGRRGAIYRPSGWSHFLASSSDKPWKVSFFFQEYCRDRHKHRRRRLFRLNSVEH